MPARAMARACGPLPAPRHIALALAMALALPVLGWICFRAVTRRPPRAELAPADSIGMLQWNLHGECFLRCRAASDAHCDGRYPACRDGALAFLRALLERNAPDFAGVEQLNDEDFLRSGLDPDRWGRSTQLCGGDRGFGLYPFDSATLYHDRAKWSALAVEGVEPGGCMELVEGAAVGDAAPGGAKGDPQTPRAPAGNDTAAGATAKNYRAYVVRAFSRVAGHERVLVAVSHNPHVLAYEAEIRALKETVALIQAKTGITKLILIADTNVNGPGSRFPGGGRTSQSVMEDIYPGAGEVASTELSDTCCAWTYAHAFDRIMAAGFPAGSSMATALPFQPTRPDWVALNMHDPILGRLEPGGLAPLAL